LFAEKIHFSWRSKFNHKSSAVFLHAEAESFIPLIERLNESNDPVHRIAIDGTRAAFHARMISSVKTAADDRE